MPFDSLPSAVTPTRRRRYGILIPPAALSAVALALSACGSSASEDSASSAESCVDTSGDTIKVGSLNSLSGTMAISEVTVRDSIKLAVDQINDDGGVLGKQIQLIGEDGASEPTIFAEKAEKLISSDCVAAVFGGWTSSSRKAMLPVFEDNNSLLYYPVQYEGLESSKNIFYTGATTNQQIVPALEYLKEKGVKSLYLVGSDYVFPQTANRIIKPTPRPTASRSRVRTTPRSVRPTSRPSSTRSAPPTPTPCSTLSTATPTWPSSVSTRTSV